jgi:hypothetical protein
MKKLEISETNARKLYKDMPDLRPSLEDTFGKAFFSGKITDRIKSYEDACAELGIQPVDETELKRLGFTDDELDYRKIKTITKALNEGWHADWSDEDQYKWYPWFRFSSGSFRFGATNYRDSYANAGVGSRLCFASDELAEYAGKQFEELYSSFIK